MDRQELNNNIRLVLEKYKKDVLDAHKAVEEAGYQITRHNGAFLVKNPKTGRTLDGGRYYKWQFDFVGYLEKPVSNYKEVQRIQNKRIGKAQERSWYIYCYRDDMKRHDRYIEEWKENIKHCLEEIEKYQDYILREKLAKQNAELALEEKKKELREKYGLKKGA